MGGLWSQVVMDVFISSIQELWHVRQKKSIFNFTLHFLSSTLHPFLFNTKWIIIFSVFRFNVTPIFASNHEFLLTRSWPISLFMWFYSFSFATLSFWPFVFHQEKVCQGIHPLTASIETRRFELDQGARDYNYCKSNCE